MPAFLTQGVMVGAVTTAALLVGLTVLGLALALAGARRANLAGSQ